MQIQTPLYTAQNHGYDALTYNGNGHEYYKYNKGSYGQKPCDENLFRGCKDAAAAGAVLQQLNSGCGMYRMRPDEMRDAVKGDGGDVQRAARSPHFTPYYTPK